MSEKCRNSNDNSYRKYHKKYGWSKLELPKLNAALIDQESQNHRQRLINALSDLKDSNCVASLFNKYLTQAAERVFRTTSSTGRGKCHRVPWFERECRDKRYLAIKSGHRVESSHDRDMQIAACRAYRATKQRKKRQYYHDCVNTIIEAYRYDRLNVWKTIERLTNT